MRNYLVYVKAEECGRQQVRATRTDRVAGGLQIAERLHGTDQSRAIEHSQGTERLQATERTQDPVPLTSLQAYVTPCFSVDKLFWQEQEARRLFVIGSSTSLAIAFAIREQINRQVSKNEFTEASVDELRSMATGFVKETNRLYGKGLAVGDQRKPLPDSLFTLDCSSDVELHSEPSPASSLNVFAITPNCTKSASALRGQIVQEAEHLYSQIAGRALFLAEMERLTEKPGQSLDTTQAALQWLVLQGKTEMRPGVRLELRKGIIRHSLAFICNRCGSGRQIILCTCHTCSQACAYCTACLEMGRSKCCTPYVCTPVMRKQEVDSPSMDSVSRLQWSGTFSAAQSIAAEHARRFVAAGNRTGRFLIWAVCGAGKTELIFPAINEALSQGGQVLVATPRKDVVLELAPRLARVFPTTKVIAVHGSSLEKWQDAQLVISTTHQVMRYYRRFALVIVDEVDAFPFRGDEMLYRAVERAAADGGRRLFLSATPPRELTRALVRSKFFQIAPSSATHVMLPLRYHGHLLPVPQVIQERRLEQKLRTGVRMDSLLSGIAETLDTERQLFLFVPRIEWIEHVLRYIGRYLPKTTAHIAGVHAADPEREQKVTLFREKRLRLIVTTTILERGVTIPRSDVIVLGADAGVFDEASLVQIAGRVGRSADAPDGMVRFITSGGSRVPYAAVKQIKRMNRLGLALRKESVAHG